MTDAADHRRGVPQGRHFHALWSRGAQELERLFPGIYSELVAAGAAVCGDGDLSRMSIRVSGHELHRSGKFSDPAAVVMHLLSRPFLESQVRRRVSAVDNVEILDGHDFVEPIAPNEHRVTGAAHASSTATPALSESWTRIWWSMRWAAAHAPRLFSTAWATVDRSPSARWPARTTPVC